MQGCREGEEDILGVQLFKLWPPRVSQAWALVRAHERPVLIVLYPLHEQVGDPQGVEEITCSLGEDGGEEVCKDEVKRWRWRGVQG